MVDVVKERPISNKLAELLTVRHESPQILVVKNGQCTYHTSHLDIHLDEALRQAEMKR
jgi:bacillithiol system protein YtxJ